MSTENNNNSNIATDIEFDSDHMKAMWAGQSNILVATRVRPLLKHEVINNKAKSCARVLDNKIVIILDPLLKNNDKQDVLRANRSREKQYAFDVAFDCNSTQESVYNNCARFLVHGVLDGYNATVFGILFIIYYTYS